MPWHDTLKGERDTQEERSPSSELRSRSKCYHSHLGEEKYISVSSTCLAVVRLKGGNHTSQKLSKTEKRFITDSQSKLSKHIQHYAI